jgi:ATP-dependent protease HslVU (ClpYQ) peptidase subunit
MTCIVAIKRDSQIVLAGDRAAVIGLDVRSVKDPKIFNIGEFYIGYTSSFRMGQLLQFKLKVKKQTKIQSDMEYMITSFVDSVKAVFKDGDFGSKDEGGCFLVVYRGEIYQIQSDFQVQRNNLGYDSVGCGSDFALATIRTLIEHTNLPTETIASHSLENAAFFNAGVKGPFDTISIKVNKTRT